MIFASKKAMSPLIATVLLIAFAVALGAMIMNWSAGMEPSHEPKQDYCKDISITTSQSVCHDGTGIRFNVKNDGQETIDGLLVRLSTPQTDTDLKIKQTLLPQERLEISQPALNPGDDTEVIFIPLSEHDSVLHECIQGGFNQNKLPQC
jgi:flagellin-like protein